MDDDKIVVLAKYESPVDAHIVKGMLEANGIVAGVLTDSTANALMSLLDQGKARVVVLERDLERARALLEG